MSNVRPHLVQDRFDKLLTKSVTLSSSSAIMPIDEIRLSVAFARLPNQAEVIPRLMALFNHGNMHVRRIVINACRRAATFNVPGLREALTRKLSDPEAWVRYDAVWALQEAEYDSSEIRGCLDELSAGVVLPDDELRLSTRLGDAQLQARVRAKRALIALRAREA